MVPPTMHQRRTPGFGAEATASRAGAAGAPGVSPTMNTPGRRSPPSLPRGRHAYGTSPVDSGAPRALRTAEMCQPDHRFDLALGGTSASQSRRDARTAAPNASKTSGSENRFSGRGVDLLGRELHERLGGGPVHAGRSVQRYQ